MSPEDLLAWQGVIVTILGLALVAVIVVAIGRQYHRVAEHRASLTRDEAYQKLASAAIVAQQQHAMELGKLTAELGEMKRSVAAIEKLLREVG